ncbi:hypothetical protein EE612_035225 [Oryza sativa]|nr:hypothetical protein EE612_035225 [Oryza sativa]
MLCACLGSGSGEGSGAAENKPKGESLVARLLHHCQHMAHIGWDGSTSTTTSLRSWNHAAPPYVVVLLLHHRVHLVSLGGAGDIKKESAPTGPRLYSSCPAVCRSQGQLRPSLPLPPTAAGAVPPPPRRSLLSRRPPCAAASPSRLERG